MNKPWGYKAIALLALIQGVVGLLRAYNWVHIGANLLGQGLLLLPVVGAVAVTRGIVISTVALLYILFFIGTLLESNWAWTGVTAAVINLLLTLSALVQGASLPETIAWSVIPAILLVYILSKPGRDAFGSR